MILCCANPCKTDCGSDKSVNKWGKLYPFLHRLGLVAMLCVPVVLHLSRPVEVGGDRGWNIFSSLTILGSHTAFFQEIRISNMACFFIYFMWPQVWLEPVYGTDVSLLLIFFLYVYLRSVLEILRASVFFCGLLLLYWSECLLTKQLILSSHVKGKWVKKAFSFQRYFVQTYLTWPESVALH